MLIPFAEKLVNALTKNASVTTRLVAHGEKLVTFKFGSSGGRVYLESASISYPILNKVIQSNFTFIERYLYLDKIEAVLIETIITFINGVAEATLVFTEKIFDEWRYLSDKNVDRTTIDYVERRILFIEFMELAIIPSTKIRKGENDFSHTKLDVSIKPRYYKKLLDIFSKVLFNEVLRSIDYYPETNKVAFKEAT